MNRMRWTLALGFSSDQTSLGPVRAGRDRSDMVITRTDAVPKYSRRPLRDLLVPLQDHLLNHHSFEERLERERAIVGYSQG